MNYLAIEQFQNINLCKSLKEDDKFHTESSKEKIPQRVLKSSLN